MTRFYLVRYQIRWTQGDSGSIAKADVMGLPKIHRGKAVMHCELLHDYSSGFSLVCEPARCFSQCGSASSEFRCLAMKTESGAYGDSKFHLVALQKSFVVTP